LISKNYEIAAVCTQLEAEVAHHEREADILKSA